MRNEAVNAEIQKFADNKRVFWLNINDKFLQPDGTLSKEIMPDLLHPNAKGYELMAPVMEQALRTALR
jgi:beta-glucosidase